MKLSPLSTAIVKGIDPDEIAHQYVSGVLAALRVKPTGSIVMIYAVGRSTITGHYSILHEV